MGFLNSLFGGGTPEQKAVKAAAPAERQTLRAAEEQNAKTAHHSALFDCALGKDPASKSYRERQGAAVKLVLAGETALGREAWLAISRDYPHELALALEQVGVCYHLDGDYRSALENYEAAIRVGADSAGLADNIAEARKGLAALG